MGKGKVKGWRPPRDGEAASSLLCGSADHLTGDTIASPVQLREEGRAIPKGHLNYGDHDSRGQWKGGSGKGSGKDGKTQEAPSEIMPSASKAPPAPKPVPKPSQAVKLAPPVPPFPESKAAPSMPSIEPDADVKEVKKEVKEEAPDMEVAKAKRMDDAKTEIERRREAMLAREKAAMLQAAANESEVDDAESRRRAAEEKRKEAEAIARAAEARRRQAAEKAKAAAAEARVRRKVASDGADETEAKVETTDSIKSETVAADEDALAKRPRLEETKNANVAPAPAANAGAAMQQGLQRWAARVNALADPSDPVMVKKCRDFVRQRILKAHATGDLHSNAWDDEPLPDDSSLLA